MKRIIVGVLMLAFITLSITSCKKYDEGGLVGQAEKRLTANEWKLDVYLRNSRDETSQLLISSFSETYSEGGTLTRYYIEEDGDVKNETGNWSFDNDKEQINISGVGSIELTDETSTVSTSDYNIIKLKKDELWYSYDNGGDTHEFHLVPN